MKKTALLSVLLLGGCMQGPTGLNGTPGKDADQTLSAQGKTNRVSTSSDTTIRVIADSFADGSENYQVCPNSAVKCPTADSAFKGTLPGLTVLTYPETDGNIMGYGREWHQYTDTIDYQNLDTISIPAAMADIRNQEYGAQAIISCPNPILSFGEYQDASLVTHNILRVIPKDSVFTEKVSVFDTLESDGWHPKYITTNIETAQSPLDSACSYTLLFN